MCALLSAQAWAEPELRTHREELRAWGKREPRSVRLETKQMGHVVEAALRGGSRLWGPHC